MKFKNLLVTAIATLVFAPAVGNTVHASTQSSAWHYGVLPWMKGYWHYKGTTYKIESDHILWRTSGWQKIGKYKSRFPYHGYDKVKYQTPISESMEFKCFNPQTSHWEWIAFLKGNSSKMIYMSYRVNGGYGKYYPLYRGNK